MNLLYQVEEVTDAALKTSPYNAVAYGVLVGVLVVALVMLWRQHKKLQERYRDHVEKTVGLMQLIESKMDTIEDVDESHRTISTKQDDLIERQKDLKREVYNLKEYVDRKAE